MSALERLKVFAADLSDVKTKHPTKEGLFTLKASGIVRGLLQQTRGNAKKALAKITFYINRAGDNLANKTEVLKAKEEIKAKADRED